MWLGVGWGFVGTFSLCLWHLFFEYLFCFERSVWLVHSICFQVGLHIDSSEISLMCLIALYVFTLALGLRRGDSGCWRRRRLQ